MQFTLATLGLAALAAAIPAPQGVTSAISPSATDPAGCSSSYNGAFQIEIVNVTSSSSKAKRQSNSMSGELKITLSNGVLMDQDGRTGYIAKNNQFQFDKPPQTGAIYTSGWSVCSNGSLAIGDSAVFSGCLSGKFYNLYDENSAPQCIPVYIVAVGAGSSSASASASAGQGGDGQPTASSVATQLTDGQPNGTPASSYPSTTAAATQITDGQPQAPSVLSHPVTQISDGQIQASTAASAPVSPITQISDGQPQAPTSVVSQISDGQIQAPTNGTNPTPTMSPVAYTGAAAMPTARIELLGLGAALLAVAAL